LRRLGRLELRGGRAERVLEVRGDPTLIPGAPSQVVESGRAGLVDFRFETLDSGRCWLCRDDKREPMWGGAFVHVQVAYAYAAEFGHAIVAKRE
jgi:hypothetical protein